MWKHLAVVAVQQAFAVCRVARVPQLNRNNVVPTMRISARLDFWGDGVGCFCHEAVVRALHAKFDGIAIDEVDVAHQKYTRAAASSQMLERSAWFEYLRNGPAQHFRLPSGVTGLYSRYKIEFEIPEGTSESEVSRVRSFLAGLAMGGPELEETA